MLERWKQEFKKAPDWLYFALFSLYWSLHPRGEKVVVFPLKDCWLRIFTRRKIFAPKCEARRSAFDRTYEQCLEVEPDDIVLDVGACIGDLTVPFAMKASKVIAIEPDPENVTWLKKNIVANRLRNVQIVKKALWNHRGTLRLWASNEDYMVHSLVVERTRAKDIQVDTLDNICCELGIEKVDFLKIDIEGAEVEALKGATETLKNAKKVVVAAYHMREGKPTWPLIQKFLEQAGFNTFVSSDGLVHAFKRRTLVDEKGRGGSIKF